MNERHKIIVCECRIILVNYIQEESQYQPFLLILVTYWKGGMLGSVCNISDKGG